MNPTAVQILVVDDEPAHQQAIRRSLEDTRPHFKIRLAASLHEYRAAVAEQCPDLAILDLVLPDGRAESVLHSPPETGPFPQVVMTSHGDEHIAVGAIQSGALDYVVKSAESFAEMHHTVDRALRTWGVITERERALARLRESEERLRMATEAAQMGTWIRDIATGGLTWSANLQRLLGYDPGTFPGTDAAFRELIHPDSVDTLAAAQERVRSGDGFFNAELHFRLRDGRERWGLVRGSAVREADHQLVRIVGVYMDITERKLLEAKFLRSQRLEGIGSLASGIAHDLNNIFAPILMTAPLLREVLKDPEDAAMLDTIATCALRGADITRQLLTFARGTPEARVPLPFRHLLREMEKIVRETFPRDIRLSLEIAPDLWPVLGDSTQLHQALMNLCINSRDAMPDGGILRVSASNTDVDASFASMISGGQPGPHVCLRVTDTGTGIAPEHIDRIFDPFFTTKEIGKGTGLGLASVLGIVRGHGGFIQVTSEPRQGTAFHLFFPASAPIRPAPEAPGPSIPRGNGECILLVDDELPIRTSMRRALQELGYEVLIATHGAEALAVFSQHQASIQAVITDMMMPVMNGPVFVNSLRKLSPGIPVLGMTGLPERDGIKGLASLDLQDLLIKPFPIATLAQAIASALAGNKNSASHHVTG
jgi:two-component system cell cycle sensor histidine kinase/response regulator CckA